MRPLETVIWILGSGCAAYGLVARPRRGLQLAFAAAAAAMLVLHLAVEGARVHMAGAYALVMIAGLRCLWRGTPPRRWVRIAAAVPLTVLIAASALLPTVFPVFAYSEPTGPFAIGTATYELPGRSPGRSLVIQAWYPVDPDTRGPVAGITTRPDRLAAAFADFTGMPALLFDHLRLVKTHAIVDAPLAGTTRHPVILFSHGPLGANRSQSIFQMEALASHGFVVIAIDHTGYASTTIFPDGHAVPPGPDAAWPVFVDARSTAMVRTWVDDTRFVIDRLVELDAHDGNGLLTGRLDLSRIGYLGASFGGSVVVQALVDEPRIKAGLAQDGKPYFFDDALTKLQRPLMYMQSAAPYMKSSDAQLARWGLDAATFKRAEQDHYARQMRLFGAATAPLYNVYIRGTDHVTFSDLYLILGFPGSGPTDIRRAHRIINDYTLAFFNQHLNGAQERLLDGDRPGPYADVTVASRNLDAKLAGNEVRP